MTKTYKLCEHLTVQKPDTQNGDPALLRCGQCSKKLRKLWKWDNKKQKYIDITEKTE